MTSQQQQESKQWQGMLASARISAATGKQGTPAGEATPATAGSVRKRYKSDRK
jgi:hypothetical protein